MPNPDDSTRFLSVAQVAEVLNTNSRDVIELLEDGALHGTRQRDRHGWRVQLGDLRDYMQFAGLDLPSPVEPGRRFLKLEDLAEILNITDHQAYALVRAGDIPAIKIGGRGQWRVEVGTLENWIRQQYARTREWVQGHPHGAARTPALREEPPPSTPKAPGRTASSSSTSCRD